MQLLHRPASGNTGSAQVFQLTAYFPRHSDHLYFLPPRRSKDTAQRLRLISSPSYHPATHDEDQEAEDIASQARYWFTLTQSWNLPVTHAMRTQPSGGDHCYALPLSDGHHVLFTDSESGMLCLGSDTPAGRTEQLSRKFIFEPPPRLARGTNPLIPTIYAVSSDLDRNLRIAAAYGDDIMLFSVPVDAIRYSTAEQEGTLLDTAVSFDDLITMRILRHPTSNARAMQEQAYAAADQSNSRFDEINMVWVHWLSTKGRAKPTSLDELWPVRASGMYVGSMSGLKALTIQERPSGGIVIWAFGQHGLATCWRMGSETSRPNND